MGTEKLASKPTEYLNERIRKTTVERLRRYERKHGLTTSVSNTIEKLLTLANAKANQ
jgi:hypothetical protein